MNPNRFSMAGMLGLVVVLGLGLASLRFATVAWTTVASLLTLGLLMTGVVGGWMLRGPNRGFWAGFALFGWSYLILANWSWVGDQFGHDLTGGLGDLAEYVHPSRETQASAVAKLFAPSPSASQVEIQQQRYIKVGNFVQIARLSICLAFALVGGIVGRHFATRAGDEAGTASAAGHPA